MFQGLRLFKGVRLFRTLEYSNSNLYLPKIFKVSDNLIKSGENLLPRSKLLSSLLHCVVIFCGKKCICSNAQHPPLQYQSCRNLGGQGLPPFPLILRDPLSGRRVNPISTRGGRLCQLLYYSLPRFSDLATALNMYPKIAPF